MWGQDVSENWRAAAAEDVLKVLSGLSESDRKEVSVAAVNGPKMTVVSGRFLHTRR